MKTSKNKRSETQSRDNKIVDNTNNRVDAKNDLQATLDAILTTLKDIKDIVEKRKPISSEDLFHQGWAVFGTAQNRTLAAWVSG